MINLKDVLVNYLNDGVELENKIYYTTAKQIMDICGGQWMRYNIPGNNIIDSHKKIGEDIINNGWLEYEPVTILIMKPNKISDDTWTIEMFVNDGNRRLYYMKDSANYGIKVPIAFRYVDKKDYKNWDKFPYRNKIEYKHEIQKG